MYAKKSGQTLLGSAVVRIQRNSFLQLLFGLTDFPGALVAVSQIFV